MSGTCSPIVALDLANVWANRPAKLDAVLPGLARGTVGNVVATGGTGKSMLMLATALGVAVGKDVGGIWGVAPEQGPAVFLSLEDPEQELRLRLHALLPFLDAADVKTAHGALHVLPLAGQAFALTRPNPNGEPSLKPDFEHLTGFLREHEPRLLVIDTLNRALGGVSENDAGAMGWIIGEIEQMALHAKCAVVLCHHVSKAALVMSNAGEAHASRGSSVITDNARWQCNLSTPSARDERFMGMSDTDRKSRVRLDFTKSNYGPPIEGRWLRRGEGGVLTVDDAPAAMRPRLKTASARART